MSIGKNDSRRSIFHEVLKNITKDVEPKAWMKPALTSHLKNLAGIEENEAEQFVDEWLKAVHGEVIHENILFGDDPAELRKCGDGRL